MADVNWLVVTDLDGTLLNHHSYEYRDALDTLRQLEQLQIPVIFNTSKTFREILDLQKTLNTFDAFIVENGSCIYLPQNKYPPPFEHCPVREAHWEWVLGMSQQDIDCILDDYPQQASLYTRLSQLGLQQAIELTGLTDTQAEQARARDFSEPIIWNASDKALNTFKQQLQAQALNFLQGGRFLHILGQSDKGRAIERLKSYFQNPLKTIVLGDSANDADMLAIADISIMVNSPSNPGLQSIITADIQTQLEAPMGWSEGVNKALERINL